MKKLLFGLLLVISFGCSTKNEPVFTVIDKVYSCYAWTYPSLFGFPAFEVYHNYQFYSNGKGEFFDTKVQPNGNIYGDIESITFVLKYPTITITKSDNTKVIGTFTSESSIRIDSKNYKQQ